MIRAVDHPLGADRLDYVGRDVGIAVGGGVDVKIRLMAHDGDRLLMALEAGRVGDDEIRFGKFRATSAISVGAQFHELPLWMSSKSFSCSAASTIGKINSGSLTRLPEKSRSGWILRPRAPFFA